MSTQSLHVPVRAVPRLRTLRVALAGCGVVGSAFARLLAERAEEIGAGHGVRVEVTSVLVRDPLRSRPGLRTGSPVTTDVAAFLEADADVIVECTGDVALAGRLAGAALLHGRSFITANKALIAASGDDLLRAAARSGAGLGMEAAVGGGAPVIRVLAESVQHAGVRSVQGVLNGTTNYIISRLSAGATSEQALADARRLGFAEADASRDLDGRDAADKLAILAWLAFGTPPRSLRVHRRGIDADAGLLAATAAAAGLQLRLLAEAAPAGDGVCAAVEPVLVGPDSPFARVPAEQNLVVIDTAHAGAITVAGPGAGGAATAVSLLADLLRPFHVRPPQRIIPPAPDRRRHDWVIGVRGRDTRVAAVPAARWEDRGELSLAFVSGATREEVARAEQAAASAGVTTAVLRLAGVHAA